MRGMMNAFATAISFAMHHGVELRFLVAKFAHVRFEPSGFTNNRQIPIAKSIIDYVFRWLALQFLLQFPVQPAEIFFYLIYPTID